MKRFYCTICQRVKRVRRMPDSIEQVNSDTPALRHGVCRWHSDPTFRLARVPVNIEGKFKPASEAQSNSRMIRNTKKGAK